MTEFLMAILEALKVWGVLFAIAFVIVLWVAFVGVSQEVHETLERVKRLEDRLDRLLKQDSQEQ